MHGRGTPPEDRRRSAAVFAKLLYQSVASRFPGRWHGDFNREAIDEGHSDSIIEFRRGKWPPRFRLSIHSDRGGSLVGYGVFRPSNMNRRSNDQGLREYLRSRVPGGGTTDVHWAWYRQVDEPLRDFSRQETLIEVEKIMHHVGDGDDAFRRASDDLVRLAEALDSWYSEGSGTLR